MHSGGGGGGGGVGLIKLWERLKTSVRGRKPVENRG